MLSVLVWAAHLLHLLNVNLGTLTTPFPGSILTYSAAPGIVSLEKIVRTLYYLVIFRINHGNSEQTYSTY